VNQTIFIIMTSLIYEMNIIQFKVTNVGSHVSLKLTFIKKFDAIFTHKL
jgi:hypothetical protein